MIERKNMKSLKNFLEARGCTTPLRNRLKPSNHHSLGIFPKKQITFDVVVSEILIFKQTDILILGANG